MFAKQAVCLTIWKQTGTACGDSPPAQANATEDLTGKDRTSKLIEGAPARTLYPNCKLLAKLETSWMTTFSTSQQQTSSSSSSSSSPFTSLSPVYFTFGTNIFVCQDGKRVGYETFFEDYELGYFSTSCKQEFPSEHLDHLGLFRHLDFSAHMRQMEVHVLRCVSSLPEHRPERKLSREMLSLMAAMFRHALREHQYGVVKSISGYGRVPPWGECLSKTKERVITPPTATVPRLVLILSKHERLGQRDAKLTAYIPQIQRHIDQRLRGLSASFPRFKTWCRNRPVHDTFLPLDCTADVLFPGKDRSDDPAALHPGNRMKSVPETEDYKTDEIETEKQRPKRMKTVSSGKNEDGDQGTRMKKAFTGGPSHGSDRNGIQQFDDLNVGQAANETVPYKGQDVSLVVLEGANGILQYQGQEANGMASYQGQGTNGMGLYQGQGANGMALYQGQGANGMALYQGQGANGMALYHGQGANGMALYHGQGTSEMSLLQQQAENKAASNSGQRTGGKAPSNGTSGRTLHQSNGGTENPLHSRNTTSQVNLHPAFDSSGMALFHNFGIQDASYADLYNMYYQSAIPQGYTPGPSFWGLETHQWPQQGWSTVGPSFPQSVMGNIHPQPKTQGSLPSSSQPSSKTQTAGRSHCLVPNDSGASDPQASLSFLLEEFGPSAEQQMPKNQSPTAGQQMPQNLSPPGQASDGSSTGQQTSDASPDLSSSSSSPSRDLSPSLGQLLSESLFVEQINDQTHFLGQPGRSSPSPHSLALSRKRSTPEGARGHKKGDAVDEMAEFVISLAKTAWCSEVALLPQQEICICSKLEALTDAVQMLVTQFPDRHIKTILWP